MKNTPALDDLPFRAQCGYICKYGRVVEGETTGAALVGILRSKGVLDDDADPEALRDVAQEVLDRRASR